MKKSLVAIAGLGLCTAGPISAPLVAQQPAPAAAAGAAAGTGRAAIDMTVLHVQVLLDHLGFGPGVIDGRGGLSFRSALAGFQSARGLPRTGEVDAATLKALHPHRSVRPVRVLALSAADATGPYQGPLPADPAAQARLPALGYADAMEKLAEKFHTTPETLAALNPGGRIAAGAMLRFPNVLPSSRDYDPKLKPEWRQTLSDLNVSAHQPQAKRIVVDKSEGVLKVYGADDQLLAQFPATMGSRHDPLPLGEWKIQGAAYNPPFHYNPDLFWDADDKDRKQLLPPGPNGPVGVIWLDLSKPHYGIHGTPSPATIGRAESHGCIRLTNWDAARLSLMVKPGTPARFQA